MWYFAENGDRKGPVTQEEMNALIGSGKVGPATLVWQEGLEDWVPITETELRDLLPTDLPPTTQIDLAAQSASSTWAATTSSASAAENEAKIQQLQNWFKWLWICLAAGIPLTLLIVGIFGLIAASILGFMLLYQFWKVIQDGPARTTPLKAILFLFIPLFGIYWQFVAFWGLAQDMNAYLRQQNITGPKLDENLPLIYCVINVCSILPSAINLSNSGDSPSLALAFFALLLVALLSIVSVVVWILMLRAFKNAAIAILRSRITA